MTFAAPRYEALATASSHIQMKKIMLQSEFCTSHPIVVSLEDHHPSRQSSQSNATTSIPVPIPIRAFDDSQCYEDERIYAYRDQCMYIRIVHGMCKYKKQKTPLSRGENLRNQNNTSIANMQTRRQQHDEDNYSQSESSQEWRNALGRHHSISNTSAIVVEDECEGIFSLDM